MQTIVSNELHLDSVNKLTKNNKTQNNKTLFFDHIFLSKKHVKQKRNKKNFTRDRNNNIQATDSISDAGTFKG